MQTNLSRKTFVRIYPLVGVLILLANFTVHDALAITVTCRVTTSGTSGGDGSNWTTQAMDLPTALATAGCGEIWVAGGIYKPTTSTTDRAASFNITRNLAMYGGFAGTETNSAQRDPRANPTILSGDIDNNDSGDNGVNTNANQLVGNNSYHVVYFNAASPDGPILADTVLDGFTITGGKADGSSSPDNCGGGLYCYGVFGTHECSPTLRNLTFSGNQAGSGGALCNDGSYGLSSPGLTHITFSGNAAFYGGAMISIGYQGKTAPIITNVTFYNNSANNGGAVYNAGYDGDSSMTLNNVSFSGNSAVNGGAFFNETGTATLNNVVLWGDSASTAGPETRNGFGGSMIINDSVVQNACTNDNTCNNIITDDPELGPLQDNGGYTNTLVPAGSAVDTGNDSTCAADDQRGISRPQGKQCDIGAVEVVPPDKIFADDFELQLCRPTSSQQPDSPTC